MGRISYRPSTEAVAATTAQTITHADNTLPKGGIKRFFLVNTGANNHLGTTTPGIDRVNVKMNDDTIYSLPADHLRILNEAVNASLGGLITAVDSLRFGIPFDLYNDGRVGIPRVFRGQGVKASVEQVYNVGNSSLGTSLIGWELLDGEPVFHPRAISTTTQVAASQTSARIDLKSGNNLVMGWIIPIVGSTGLTRLKIMRVNGDGSEDQVFHGTQGIILESQSHLTPQALTTTFFFRLPGGPQRFPTGSFMEVDTGAGSAVGNSYTPVELIPNALAA